MKVLFTILLSLYISLCSGQTDSYSTVKIAKWVVEKFPINQLIKPKKVYTEKDKFTGKMIFYQELDDYGNPDGLTVYIQQDFVSPHTIYYYRKGVAIYEAAFFNKSNKANEIINRNLEWDRSGPYVSREFIDGRLSETVEIYKDGNRITNGINLADKAYWQNGLLEGKFKFFQNETDKLYEGEAKNGEIIFQRVTQAGKNIVESKVFKDSVYLIGLKGSTKGQKQGFKIVERLKVTNDSKLIGIDGYFFCREVSDIRFVLRKMRGADLED